MGRKKISEEEKIKTRFILKGNKNCHFHNDTDVEFAVPKKLSIYKKVLKRPVLPAFNNDYCYYTPGFILKQVDSPSASDYFSNHCKKIQQSLLQVDQSLILISKPRSKNKYCGVCRQTFQDYLQHIQSQKHHTRLQRSSSQQHIKLLCVYYNKKYCKNQKQQETHKSISISKSMNEDENTTESFIDQKKTNKNQQFFDHQKQSIEA